MKPFSVLIADDRYGVYDEERAVLEAMGAEVMVEPSLEEAVLCDRVADVDGLIVNLAPITARVIDAMTRCKCVSRYGVGCDNVDAEALKKKGVFLANVPDYCAEDVSDQAFALWMDCVRKVARKDRLIRAGGWNLQRTQPVHRISGQTFAFVGFGLIARTFHRKLAGFNLGRVLVSDPAVSEADAKEAGVELADLETICREADTISLHAPLLPATRGMIGAEQFALMKKTAFIINTSRGPLIDEVALIAALKSGQIACAGLDVFETEPLPADSELRRLDNVTLTDHAGWYSEESLVELKTKAAKNIADTLVKGEPTYSVKL